MRPDVREPLLERYGRSEKNSLTLLQRLPDGYWTPWHIAEDSLTDALKLADKALAELEKLRARMDSAPAAIMDTRDVLGICAPTEDDFPALYALRGKRVRLVVEDELHAHGDGAKQGMVR